MNKAKILVLDDENIKEYINSIFDFVVQFDDSKIDLTFITFKTELNPNEEINYDLYDIVISDYHLGDGKNNGIEVLKDIKSNGYIGNLLLITGDNELVQKNESKMIDEIKFIHKTDIDEIISYIKGIYV